jgi:hypothetical protein
MLKQAADLLVSLQGQQASLSRPSEDSVTACGLTVSQLHEAIRNSDQLEKQAQCPHLQIGANPDGVLCRDCRKQWVGEDAERIWAALQPGQQASREQEREIERLSAELDRMVEARMVLGNDLEAKLRAAEQQIKTLRTLVERRLTKDPGDCQVYWEWDAREALGLEQPK